MASVVQQPKKWYTPLPNVADRMAEGARVRLPDGRDAYAALAEKYAGNRPRRLDAGVMNALALQFESARDILRFYRERCAAIDLSRNRGDFAAARRCVSRMRALVRREQGISGEMRALAVADPRLGFHSEAESHQYHPAKLAWRIGELDSTLSDLDRIDAALARNAPYPESEFERTAPVCTVGDAAWTDGKGLSLRVDETPDGDLSVAVRTKEGSVTIYTFDAAGTQWPRGVRLSANGTIVTPVAGNVVTPGHVARGKVTRDANEIVYTITLSASGWNRDTALRPEWLQVRTGNGLWPDLPKVEGRLNLGSVQGNRFGRLIRR